MDKKIKNKIYKTYYKNLDKTLLIGAVLSLVFILIFGALGFLTSLIGRGISLNLVDLAITFLVLFVISIFIEPLIYSYFACNITLRTKQREQVTIGGFFRTREIAKRPPFKNQLSIFRSFLITFFIYLALFFVSNSLFSLFGMIENNFAHDFIVDISNLNFSASTFYDDLLFLVEKHAETINLIVVYSTFISSFLSCYYLLNKVSRNIICYLAAPLILSVNGRMTSFVIRAGLKGIRKKYYGEYFSALWPLTLGYLIFFPATYFLLFFFGPSGVSSTILMLSSLLVVIVFYVAFLPLIFDTSEVLWFNFADRFLSAFLEQTEEEIKEIKENEMLHNHISNEEVVKIENKIAEMKINFRMYIETLKISEPLMDFSDSTIKKEK